MDELIGQKLKYDIMSGNGMVLIPAGTSLAQEHIRLMRMHRIQPDDLRFTADAPPTDITAEMVRKATSYTKDLFNTIKMRKKIPLMEIKNDLLPMVRQATENPNLFKLFEAVRAKDEYTHQHNVGVSILATLLGKWCNLDENELSLLSLGATLHDVGKIKISDEILHKPGKLTPQEFEEIKRHTIYGYEMLKEAVGLNPRVAFVALQHHERDDGSGYPLKLKAPQIDRLSRIVAVVDIFHAMSSKRPYHDALPFHEVVNRMRSGFFGELDPSIMSLFLRNIVKGMLGKQVMLSDGRSGEVIYINPHEDTKPLILVNNSFIDLSRERDLSIREVIG